MSAIFEYEFLQRAFIVGTLLAVILPCIGLTVLLKRLSMMGDTLAHASLAGVALGLLVGINPLFFAVAACVIAGLGIETIAAKLKAYQEISTVIILSAAIGLAGIFTSYTSGNVISSYLFGSIVTISDAEFYLVLAVSALVVIVYTVIYKQLYLLVFDSKAAEILGIKSRWLNFIFTLLGAITISIAAKTIGSLIVSSLLVLPVICAMQFSKTYKQTLFISIALSAAYVYIGLICSYYFDLKPGSVIVLIAVIVLLAVMAVKYRRRA